MLWSHYYEYINTKMPINCHEFQGQNTNLSYYKPVFVDTSLFEITRIECMQFIYCTMYLKAVNFIKQNLKKYTLQVSTQTENNFFPVSFFNCTL